MCLCYFRSFVDKKVHNVYLEFWRNVCRMKQVVNFIQTQSYNTKKQHNFAIAFYVFSCICSEPVCVTHIIHMLLCYFDVEQHLHSDNISEC